MDIYEINEKSFWGITKKEYVKNITQSIDISLKYNGVHISQIIFVIDRITK